MFQGNWQCSGCNNPITELPFEPKSTNNLLCKQCFASGKGSGGGTPKPQGDKQMFQGAWECNGCKNPITELPFQPRDTSNLMCKDCFRNSRNN